MTRPPLELLAEQVSGPRMMAHLEVFDGHTKHAGTPTELESLRYVRQELDEYGYRTELISHEAYISLPGPARVQAPGREMVCITHSFSRSTEPGGAAGEVVYVGPGSEADFARADVRGRIALIEGIANPAASLRASRAGAKGQIHISPHEHLHEMCISPVWGSPTQRTAGQLPATVVVTVALTDGEALKRALERGPLTATLHAQVDTGWRDTPILIAELDPPRARRPPQVLFSGHHDTWYYGVMDNGGANATMLEVARLAAGRRREWRRGLRVAFWSGHSQGRYSGSTWYADAHWEELAGRLVAHVNVDSTGGRGNTVVSDTTAAHELHGLAREALSAQAGQEFSGRRMQRAGDQSFWGMGVPAIFGNMSEQPAGSEPNAMAAVFGGENRKGNGTGWWWHNPADTLDKMDEEILVRDTRIYLHAVWRLLTDPVLPLDYAEWARYATREFTRLQESAGTQVDLSPLVERAKRLERRARALNQAAGKATGEGVARINESLREVSRWLVPIDYTEGDPFEHDPALGQPAFPSLAPAAGLARLDAGDPRAGFLRTQTIRARNRVAHALAGATEAIERCLLALATPAREGSRRKTGRPARASRPGRS